MNRLEELWYETEGSNIKNLNLKYSLFFYRYTIKKFGIKRTKLLFDKMSFMVPYNILAYYSIFPIELKVWVKNNLINKLNKEKIISLFIQNINNALTQNNKKRVDLYIKNLKELNIIKNIEIDNENILILTLNDDRKYNFFKLLNTQKEIDFCSNNCHDLCYSYIKKHINNNSYVVTVLERDLFNRRHYHSFIVKDGLVYDYARNIIMGFENYKTLFNNNIVMYCEGKELLKRIEILEKEDNDFIRLKKWCPVLKYTLYTMNKESNKNN